MIQSVQDQGSTINIYAEFERLVKEIITEQEISDLAKVPGEKPSENVNRNELNYMLAYLALARSAKRQSNEEGELFRQWTRSAIRRAARKIDYNRRLVLLHTVTIRPDFVQNNLAHFLIVLFEEDR